MILLAKEDHAPERKELFMLNNGERVGEFPCTVIVATLRVLPCIETLVEQVVCLKSLRTAVFVSSEPLFWLRLNGHVSCRSYIRETEFTDSLIKYVERGLTRYYCCVPLHVYPVLLHTLLVPLIFGTTIPTSFNFTVFSIVCNYINV